MITETRIQDAIKEIKSYYLLPSGKLKYPTDKEGVLGRIDPLYFDESILYRAYFFLTTIVFTTLSTENPTTLAKALSSAKAMSALGLKLISKHLCSCSHYKDDPADYFSNTMIIIMPLLTPSALLSDWEELETLAHDCIDSLNAQNCIIQRGQPHAIIAWYVIKLLSMAFDIPIDKRKPFTPPKDKFKYYALLLENWAIDDLLRVEEQAYQLCELHIYGDEYIDNGLQYHIDEEVATILPYEVIIWLKLREYKGLKNPKTFSHPLMQTPIMKKLLQIDTEKLPEPQGDPELKVFLEEKLRVMCPDNDIEIPVWLGGEKN